MRAKFDSNAAQHYEQQNYVEREVEGGEARSIDQGKGEIEGSSGGDQPHFIAVPDWTDAANHGQTFFFGACNKHVQYTRAKVEAVEHGISCDHASDEHKPKRFHCTPPKSL